MKGLALGEPGERGADAVVERAGRWLASRLTRRSFLDRAARVGVLVAGGPTLAVLLADGAAARVCGQTGITPRCPTYDCVGPGDVWGWCWYSSPGCCTNGGLKKICDCCRVDYPNVHGYCPAGTNVRCIVESCWADPRVMTVPTARVRGLTAAAIASGRSRHQHLRGAHEHAVLAASDNPFAAPMAAPVAAALGAPLLVTPTARLAGSTVSELQRLGVRRVFVVGPGITAAVEEDLVRYGLSIERLTSESAEPGPASLEVAMWLTSRAQPRRAWCVTGSGLSLAAAAAAGAAAGAGKVPLLVGIDAARTAAAGELDIAVTYLVGPEAAARADEVPGGVPVRGHDLAGLSLEIARIVVDAERRTGLTLITAPAASAASARGACSPGVLLHHVDGTLGPAHLDWIADRPDAWISGVAAGTVGALDDPAYHDLQAALNRFETRALTGVAGQGLPVFEQPLSERDLGGARIASAPSTELSGGYWIARANPDR